MRLDDRGPELAVAVARRTDRIVEALASLDDRTLLAPCALPGWSRLTVACHLRYGAEAFTRVTEAAVAGLLAAYYPDGRARQRPGTLEPAPGETPSDVVAALAQSSAELHRRWSTLTDEEWRVDVTEPGDHPDLGTLPLFQLPLFRLTEVEVHGTDLAVGLDDWSDLFVELALPARLYALNRRRTNHRAVDDRVGGTWLLVASDGPTYRVDDGPIDQPARTSASATAVIEASSRDLLALLLGRPFRQVPRYAGNQALGRAFSRAFPGP